MISGSHAASSVPGATVVSNVDAMEQGIAHPEQRMEVQAVRSSPEECINLPVSNSSGILSRLCSSLCCIRSVSELGASVVLPPPSALLSVPYSNPERSLSPSAGSVYGDDLVVVAPTAGAEESSGEQLLSVYPERMEEEIIVDHAHRIGYRKHNVESESFIYLDDRKYALKDSKDLVKLAIFDLAAMQKLRFYRERLSHQWHCCVSSAPVFNENEKAFIDKSKIAKDEQFYYVAVKSVFPLFFGYGDAKIYHTRCLDGSRGLSPMSVIELYGELVPVRIKDGHYEAYCRDKPDETLLVEWDDVRWVSMRHELSMIAQVGQMLAHGQNHAEHYIALSLPNYEEGAHQNLRVTEGHIFTIDGKLFMHEREAP